MRIFRHCLSQTLRSMWGPGLLALLACAGCLAMLRPPVGSGPDHEAGLWLYLPALVLCTTALLGLLEAWPPLSRERPGQDWLLRLRPHGLHGALPAALGGLSALVAGLGALGLAFSLLLPTCGRDPGPVRERLRLSASTQMLHPGQPLLRLRLDGAQAIHSLLLHPRAVFVPGQSSAAGLQLRGDGQPLHEGVLHNLGDRQVLTLRPPRPIRVLEVARVPGPGLPLRFDPASLLALTERSPPVWLNACLALLHFLPIACLSLGALLLGIQCLNFAVQVLVLAGGLVLCAAAEIGPTAAALRAFSRGWWLGNEPLWGSWLTPLALCVGCLAGAWAQRRWRR